MQQKFCIFYFQNSLTVLQNEGEQLTVTRPLVSKRQSDLMEEAKETLKEITGSSFLYAPEFKHVYCGDQNLLVPSGVFEKDFTQAYFERMFIALSTEKTLVVSPITSFGVHAIEAQPSWAKAFTKETFNHQNTKSQFEFHLEFLAEYKGKESSLLVAVFNETCFVGLVNDNRLMYAETMSYQNADDILYTLLNVLQKNSLGMTKGTLWFGDLSGNNVAEKLKESLASIQDFTAFTYQDLARTMYFK